MSNQNEDLKLFNYLISNSFLNDIKQIEDVQSYNFLVGLHLLAIGFSTTGISSGGFSIKYSQKISPEYEDFLRAKFDFYFYTTKNSLIEDSSRCSNSYQKFSNQFFYCSHGRSFKEEVLNLFNDSSRIIEEANYFKNNQLLIEDSVNFSLLGKKRNSDEAKIQFIQQINRNVLAKTLLNYELLSLEFIGNEKEYKKKKFKL